ncbi:hypothetical protein LJR230_001803 [Trinickia sp. LjRoot230]|uniref:RHS repeat-associated core domain-containing protein n=1 Tax=Trinickia sp. LjRoot230 TaxID=3342288 RepID=UPI003ED03BAD
MTSSNPAFGTPTITVLSNRGTAVRMLRYNRRSAENAVDELIECTTYDSLDHVASRIDARLCASGSPNFAYISSLSGRVIRTDSVDAGMQWTLCDIDGRPVWALDARGTGTTRTYDKLGRPWTIAETVETASATRDVWIYGEQQVDAQAHNLRGQCVRRYDTAGKRSWGGFRLTGQPLDETCWLLGDAEADPDWFGQDDESAWVSELDGTAYLSTWVHDAMGMWVTQTDAKNNVEQRGFDVAGRLANSSLALAAGGVAKPVLSAIDYSAAGRVLSETAGNGAISSHTYEPQTQRLIGLKVTRAAQANRATVVQDLSYTYDPVGNVVRVSDAAQVNSYWRNQKIEPARIYGYDALYQLISATGRETANRGAQTATLPTPTMPLPSDDSVYANYTRTYTYDTGCNLATIQHQGTSSYTQAIVVSDRSNHAVLQAASLQLGPGDIDNGTWFDARGNQRMLVPGSVQPLAWDSRNRLQKVTLIKRNGPDDDRETYQYDCDGMRVRKRMTTQAKGVMRTVEVIYLPGLTLRVTSSGDGKAMTVSEKLQEISCEAGSIHARCLHWEVGQPASVTGNVMRYGTSDPINSITVELDANAELISREEYYPYGGTAVWTARGQVEADTKFVRYSGKERDATGLYYYGYRYYQPWAGRWLNTDPAGTVDGLNLYRMVRNNPVTLADNDGLVADVSGSKKVVSDTVENDSAEATKSADGLPNMLESTSNHGDVSPLPGAQINDRPLDPSAATRAERKQIFQNSCGAASLLCVAKELGIEKIPAYQGSLSELGGGNLELNHESEQDLFTITSGMTTQRRQSRSIQEAGYSLPQHLLFAGRLLGLEMEIHEQPGPLSSALNWLYPNVKKELPPGTVVKPDAPELRHGEAELKALAVTIAKVPIGLHWVMHRADGSYMDPATGKTAENFDEMQRNMRAESAWFAGYQDTGISIVARKNR